MSAALEDDLMVPQNLITPSLWMLGAALAASFLVSVEVVEAVQGEISSFKDYGALACAGAALLVSPVVIKEALSPLARQHRTARLGIVSALSATAMYQFAYGLGLFV